MSLEPAKIKAIRDLLQIGKKQIEVAQEMGVHASTVNRIALGIYHKASPDEAEGEEDDSEQDLLTQILKTTPDRIATLKANKENLMKTMAEKLPDTKMDMENQASFAILSTLDAVGPAPAPRPRHPKALTTERMPWDEVERRAARDDKLVLHAQALDGLDADLYKQALQIVYHALSREVWGTYTADTLVESTLKILLSQTEKQEETDAPAKA